MAKEFQTFEQFAAQKKDREAKKKGSRSGGMDPVVAGIIKQMEKGRKRFGGTERGGGTTAPMTEAARREHRRQVDKRK